MIDFRKRKWGFRIGTIVESIFIGILFFLVILGIVTANAYARAAQNLTETNYLHMVSEDGTRFIFYLED